ncbi:MAG: type II secretion system protein [Sulfurospirillum sp.]
MKRAFTLIEILVSIVLLGLISIFVTSTIYQTKTGIEIFKNKVEETSKIEKFQDVLYRDLLQSNELNTQEYKRYSVVYFRSKNTVYGISNPYIVWFVSKKDDTLVRIESSRQIQLPILEENLKYMFLDSTLKNCKVFLVKLSKDKKDILVYIKIKNQKSTIFEIAKI